MRQINFDLEHSVRITPVSGRTNVTVETSGQVMVFHEKRRAEPRPKPVLIVRTKNAVMTASPQGKNITVKMVLPACHASSEAFVSELQALSMQLSNKIFLS